MADYFSLDAKSQRELLLTASAQIGRHAAVLEKDIWVVRPGSLRLVPAPEAAARLREDYEAMVEGGFLGGWQPAFDEVLRICGQIQAEANATGPA